MDTVVIIAPEPDLHAQVVAKRIEDLGGRAVVLDSARFPTDWRLTVRLSSAGSEGVIIEHGDIRVSDEQVAGVWWRRPCWYRASPAVTETNLRRFIALEARQALEGWLHGLGDRVINPLAADASAAFKLLQLRTAAQIGLRVPQTVATNSVPAAEDFAARPDAATVFKAFTGADWQFIGTQRLTQDARAHLDCVSYSPVLFQEEIVKELDVRANVVDGEVYAIGIRSKRRKPLVDWRIDPDLEYLPHELPAEVATGLVTLVRRLGLRFGACDLAVDERGEHVFFEVNPGGQWLFAEIMTGQELSNAFARALLRAPGPTGAPPAAPVSSPPTGIPPAVLANGETR